MLLHTEKENGRTRFCVTVLPLVSTSLRIKTDASAKSRLSNFDETCAINIHSFAQEFRHLSEVLSELLFQWAEILKGIFSSY